MITVNLMGLVAPLIAWYWYDWRMAVLIFLCQSKIIFTFGKRG